MALRKSQSAAYFQEQSQESKFRAFFGLPDNEASLVDLNAIFALRGKPEVYTGKLYLSESFLCFTSLDRRSCRLALPLQTIRRVEKLAPGQNGVHALERIGVGVYALTIELCTGARIILQLNSLRPTCEQFSNTLKVQLKAAVPQMKALRSTTKTFYSEIVVQDETPSNPEKGKGPEVATGILVDVGSADRAKEGVEYTTTGGIGHGWHGGLGLIYKYPGDARKLRERSKMKLWRDYFQAHGRNLTIVRYPAFTRLVQVGLPNRLRGEIWEVTSGAIHLRTANSGEYERILAAHEGKTSLSTEEIEKDLNRSLPEYPAYQTPEGIQTLRRVLTCYSWKNPDIGYCQGLNLIVSAFLIYTSEEQCFWLLSILCDRLLPGYYSPSMYGTLLDQKVFEHLVQRCLPMLHEHFVETDIQLSVASLPWFMSLFISTMPLIFAFRIVDNFYLMGPKVLFQVALAILRINGEELLQVTDDGAFINVLKTYFASLGDSAHPNSTDPRLRQVTRFQVLLVTAFREFGIITDDTVASERKRFRAEVVESIETFIKRTAIRNLSSTGRLSKADLSSAHDTFQLALFRSPRSRSVIYRDPSGRPESRIDRAAFRVLLSEVASWAREERVVKNGFVERVERDLAPEHEFVERIFSSWDAENRGSLSFQDVVTGLDGVMFNDLMDNIAWFLAVHDKNKDGWLTKDEMLQLSESLLFIFRNEHGDHYLAAVSRLMQNAFEYAETIKEEANSAANGVEGPEMTEDEAKAARRRSGSIAEQPHRPYISLATLRMVVLADEVLESFFLTDLTASWRLQAQTVAPAPVNAKGPAGFFGGLANTVNSFLTDEHKERLNRLADEVGKRLDIQSVEQLPSIGKLDPTAEPKTRESLFTPSPNPQQRSPSPSISTTSGSPMVTRTPSVDPLSAAAMRMPAEGLTSPPLPPTSSGLSYAPREAKSPRPSAMSTALTMANQLPQRQTFSLDRAVNEDVSGATEEDEEVDVEAGAAGDDVMDEVEAFLKENE